MNRHSLYLSISSDLRLPMLRFGQGSPRVLFVVGMHGDEYSQQLVVGKLVEKLSLKIGTLDIITQANPRGLQEASEVNPVDHLNMNRIFPGKADGSVSERMAHAIFQKAKTYDVVIDLHNFTNPSPIFTIFVPHGIEALNARVLDLCRTYQPDYIWRIDLRKKDADQTLRGTLMYNLVRSGVPAFGVELPPIQTMTALQVRQAVDGLRRVLISLGMLRSAYRSRRRKLRSFERQNILAEYEGLFLPAARLNAFIRKNQAIGHILSLIDYSFYPVRSVASGPLVNISWSKYVKKGAKLGSIALRVTFV